MANLIVGGVVLLIVVLAARSLYKKHKNGTSSCGCDCGSCGCGCHGSDD